MTQPKLIDSWDISDPIKGTTEIYEINDWSFEVVRDEEGNIYTDEDHNDGDLANARKTTKTWAAWVNYLESN